MRRSDRLFDIIQRLRTARVPLTAASLAESLEVTVRTIYRDIAVLQARRVPIEGAAGVGYVLRRGYDLPPLAFSTEEREAITVGLRLLRRTGDVGLQKSAESVLSKLEVASPCGTAQESAFFVSGFGAVPSAAVDLSKVRDAIRDHRKLCIEYRTNAADRMRRIIRPLAIAYYVKNTVIGAVREARRLSAFPDRSNRYADGSGISLRRSRWRACRGMVKTAQISRSHVDIIAYGRRRACSPSVTGPCRTSSR